MAEVPQRLRAALADRYEIERELGEGGMATVYLARDGKVYVDFVQNGHGRLIAAPFTVRPLPGAPVYASSSHPTSRVRTSA